MKNARLVLASSVAAAALIAAPANAATQQTTFLVTANVNSSCTISAADLVFGDYDPTGGDVDGQSNVTLNCTNSSPWNVGLNAGTFAGATVTTRKMTGPGAYSLSYGLYSDAARSTNWGNTVGTDTVSGTGTGGSQIVTVYGRIPGTQNVGAGGYQDTITATVTF
jgi:spore coat protein U-like protein